jgi:hypothetical protein
MPTTAFQHFSQDIARATALVDHADALPDGTAAERLLRSDIFRTGWMFATGALDAYLCDAYTWVVGGTLIAKDINPAIELPAKLMDISLPVAAYLEHYQIRDRWRWRMAARRMMDERNMLNLGAVEATFRPFLPNGQKIYHDVVVAWVTAAAAKERIFGITPAAFGALTPQQKNGRRQFFIDAMRARFDDVIVQRRHDCIHNCDRPRVAPQRLDRAGTVKNVIRDVSFFGERFNTHLDIQFRIFLRGLGFSAAIVQAATH